MRKQETITINEKTFKELKSLYDQAVKNKDTTFFFQEKELLTDYAKYLVEYLGPSLTLKYEDNDTIQIQNRK